MAESAAAAQIDGKVTDEKTRDAWAHALGLSCTLTVDMPLPGFTIADILRLGPQALVNSHWQVGADVPLRANGRLMACGEFEVVDNHLALRLTELA